ncbi:hypothetical protein HME9304_00425 [Flagellimonas maritima]|uniref:Periplasmic heavy metal sensor n=1 Tax=Flagellimonas maritima TaxID=1383885 RepID=A0A2Z4LQB2_9FLAO|nr:hypothetical protein [Allomuricauda aurantiaca]AWX43437.1 hypothetical protein HME9304_00425 [Allomuricauda aurantiaca]
MKRPIICIFLFSIILCSAQQDCSLGIGGENDDTITEVFQLNAEQVEKMRNWGAELKVRNDILKSKAAYLLKKNEESAPEDLISMSYEYKKLLDSMKQNSRMLDKRMLSIFNNKQYSLYTELCDQLALTPIFVNRSVNEK